MSEKNKLVVDGIAWLGNVSTSVAIIFINKVLMARTGYGFVYGTPQTITITSEALIKLSHGV